MHSAHREERKMLPWESCEFSLISRATKWVILEREGEKLRQSHKMNSLFQLKVIKKRLYQNRRLEIKTKIKGNEVDVLYITSLIAGGAGDGETMGILWVFNSIETEPCSLCDVTAGKKCQVRTVCISHLPRPAEKPHQPLEVSEGTRWQGFPGKAAREQSGSEGLARSSGFALPPGALP